MATLIIKNTPAEGPGTIEEHLKNRGMSYRILEFSKGEQVFGIDEYSHLIVMGGPMAVYEMERYPYLRTEAELIKEFIKKGKSVLGICLGAQMIAHALGAKVYPGGIQEVGWYKVDLTPEGMEDPAVSALSVNNAPYAEVFQWHGDTFDLPGDAVRIASADIYQNQAFRYRNNVYALQFHIEVTPEIIVEWFEDEKGVDIDKMLRQTNDIFREYHGRAMNFYDKFFS